MRGAEDKAASAGKEHKFFCLATETCLKVKVGRGNIRDHREPRLPAAGWKTKKPNPSMMKYKLICFSPCPTSLPGTEKYL